MGLLPGPAPAPSEPKEMDRQKILIIEDDEAIRSQMEWALKAEFSIFPAGEPEAAMRIMGEEQPSIITLDLGLPPCENDVSEGFKLLGWILQQNPLAKVIVVTGNSERGSAMRAISQGAHDFLVKPVDVEELMIILKRAAYVHSLESEQMKSQKCALNQGFEEVLGMSPMMQEVFATIRKVAASDVPVLITGESGTGKELVARAIHSQSIRRGRPMIPINCGAIPENLLESELFGHEKGAFTGAHMQRPGRIELAQGGTLMLDEIGDLPLPLQVKVLRFLQDHLIERVGGRDPISIDARVVAATNKCLRRQTSEGRFREDLYYRLAVVTIELPALRDRGEDIVLLARAFLQKYAPERGRPKALSPDALDALNAYGWPGNVRELENRIRRAITFSEGQTIKPSDLGFGPMEDAPRLLDLKKAKEDLELKFVQMAIVKHNGNISKAAGELGLSRPTVHHIIKKHNISEAVRKG